MNPPPAILHSMPISGTPGGQSQSEHPKYLCPPGQGRDECPCRPRRGQRTVKAGGLYPSPNTQCARAPATGRPEHPSRVRQGANHLPSTPKLLRPPLPGGARTPNRSAFMGGHGTFPNTPKALASPLGLARIAIPITSSPGAVASSNTQETNAPPLPAIPDLNTHHPIAGGHSIAERPDDECPQLPTRKRNGTHGQQVV